MYDFKNCVIMNRQTSILTLLVTFVSACGAYYFFKKRNSKRPPKKWRKLGYVKSLYIYPLKSGSYLDIQKVECGKFGFSLPAIENMYQLRDRSFMVYSEAHMEGKWIGIYNKMVLIALSSKDQNHVLLEAPEKYALCVEVPTQNNSNVKTIRFQSWSKDDVPIIDCGDEASKWLSQFLLQKDSGLRLGFHDKPFYNGLKMRKGLYENFGPVMLMNYKTMTDLNAKLEEKVTDAYFRPNIVLDGPDLEPFEEDNCVWLKIGNVVARNFFDCVRCIAITVNPKTGLRDKTREPLKELSKYRMSNGPRKGPKMGVYLEVINPGTISVLDEVYVGIED
ncbi:hypothetical protein WA026_010658 [Henosepilachna vigintioctopunctata]|uniref:MOSC domain-containing protein n=1 Tax=Henosepilachna vigintioctopunctata TaxID=420089 RepID=A0AAW1UNS0_9CUCU